MKIFDIGKPNKKASLNLSINAIVIIVLAMTLLGLGLTFIRGIFRKAGGITETTFEKISEQLDTDLQTSEAPLLFSETRLAMERGGPSSLEGFGVRNDGNVPISYGIKIVAFSCPDAAEVDGECPAVDNWFTYFTGDEQYTINPAERQVNKVTIDVERGATTGLYLLKILAYTGTWDGQECKGPEAACDVFGQTELFLTIV